MITDAGTVHIKKYFAQLVPNVAQSIAFGIGDAAVDSTHTKLQFEVARADIVLTSYNFVSDRVVYKAIIPEEFVGKINEVALFSAPSNVVAGEFSSKMVADFNDATEGWTSSGSPSTFQESSLARIANKFLIQSTEPSGTSIDLLDEINMNFEGYSGADKFVFAFHVDGSNTSSVRFRFHTDASNYYEFNLGAQTAGYKIVEVAKASATTTGTPRWSNITQIRVVSTASSDGTSSVGFDGIRVEDVDTANPSYLMVSRELISPTFEKVRGRTQEIEIQLGLFVEE